MGIHDGKGSECEALLLHEGEDLPDLLVGRDLDRVGDEAVDVVFDPRDFLELQALWHVAVDEAQAAREGHGDGHGGFGYGVHVCRDDGQMEVEAVVEDGIEKGFAWEYVGVLGGQGDVVVGEGEPCVFGKEFRGGFVERGVCGCCHEGECQRRSWEKRRKRRGGIRVWTGGCVRWGRRSLGMRGARPWIRPGM